MRNHNNKPPYTKRLSVLLADPSIKAAGSSASGRRSIFVIAGSLHDKGAGHLADAINTNTQKELTALAREIALGGYYEEAAAIAALASDFQ